MKAMPLPQVSDVVGATDGARAWLDEAAVRHRAGQSLNTGLTRELWKYTPLKGLLEALADSARDPAPTFVNADQPGVRVRPFQALDATEEALVHRLVSDRLAPERHPVADLTLLRARAGWLIEVSGEATQPLEIHYPVRGTVPVFVLLAANASLTLIEHLDLEGFLAQVSHAELAPGARLCHHRSALQKDLPHYSLQSVRLERDASYQLNQACVGGKHRRAEVHVVLDGAGARTDMTGAYLVEHGQHLDQQLLVEHRAGHTVSRQKFHGIGAGKGRSVFNGRIHIHRHAPGSDGNLSNKNLALHPDAEMNTKPELEIYTDDVRCAHGATVGQMSTDSLFYLTARGIPQTQARRLLAHGFVRECLAGPLAERAAARFMEALS
jgi:Fe-S cluster assembly protein SufD